MGNTELLKRLLKIERNGSINLDPDFITLLNDIKMEVYNEEKGFTSTEKKANKKAAAFLKKAYKRRPVLSVCDIQTTNGIDYQVFTDSYAAFYMKKHYKLETIEDLNNREATQLKYPDVVRLLPDETDGSLIQNGKQLLDEALKKHKAGLLKQLDSMTVCELYHGDKKITVDILKLKSVIEIMGTSDLDIYFYGSFKPLLFIDNITGNKAILLPIRTR